MSSIAARVLEDAARAESLLASTQVDQQPVRVQGAQ